MQRELGKLEQIVEREMGLLRRLPCAVPDEPCLARVRAAVLAENQRLVRRRRLLRISRTVAGAAAAVLLAVSLRLPAGLHSADPEAILGEWAVAWDASRTRVAHLLDEGWRGEETDDRVDDEAAIDDLFQSLSQTLDRFEDL